MVTWIDKKKGMNQGCQAILVADLIFVNVNLK